MGYDPKISPFPLTLSFETATILSESYLLFHFKVIKYQNINDNI